MKHFIVPTLLTFLFLILGTFIGQADVVFDLVDRTDIEPVWSGHPVGFALLTEGDYQFAAYYDAERNMTVAQRKLNDKNWTIKRLPTKVGWDSHNSVTMILDQDGFLHVSGNMHCVPLIYFRSEKPFDVSSLVQVPSMTGKNEQRCTYPQFITGLNKELFFTYRDGGSGEGNQFWNVYNAESKTWTRLFDTPFFDGQSQMSAYFSLPLLGPDGFYHLTWVWRDTPDCRTNHSISYARSRDLHTWENSKGQTYTLPITLENSGIVDPVPAAGGLLNTHQRIGFNLEGRVIVSYSKYDEAGNFQIYNARLESGEWKYYQTSDWDYRWEFTGNGTIRMEVGMGGVEIKGGKLVQRFSHLKEGSGRWHLDPQTLKPIGLVSNSVHLPAALGKIELDFPGLQSRSADDIADHRRPYLNNQTRHTLRWETQPSNRDRPQATIPPPSMLRVLKLQSNH